jgi:hypothetical protein
MYYWIAPISLLTARILWQRMPGLPTCALFWGLAVVVLAFGWPVGIPMFVFAAGILCNASVTLANGGFMPVAEHRKRAGPARSLWVQRHTGQHLLFLADNFGNRYIRFSVGDVLLLAGIVLSIFLT